MSVGLKKEGLGGSLQGQEQETPFFMYGPSLPSF